MPSKQVRTTSNVPARPEHDRDDRKTNMPKNQRGKKTKHVSKAAFTHIAAVTQKHLLHRNPSTHTHHFTQRRFNTQTLLHTDTFTHKSFYKQTLLHRCTSTHRKPFTHRCFYTQRLLHTEDCTHRSFYTEAFTHRHLYTQKHLHTHTL